MKTAVVTFMQRTEQSRDRVGSQTESLLPCLALNVLSLPEEDTARETELMKGIA
jgi:hypothetical protein